MAEQATDSDGKHDIKQVDRLLSSENLSMGICTPLDSDAGWTV